MMAIQDITSGKLLTKQAMGKNIYTKNMYILKRGAHGSIAG
jgi:hypothetical protein